MENKTPWSFCETPEEKCTMNYCDDNGCQNRKKNFVLGTDCIGNNTEELTGNKSIFLWLEGFSATGESSGAVMLGNYEAKNFDDAVIQYMKENKSEVNWDGSGKKEHNIWGCRIFDNEEDARKSFG
jgi:hypothetical protein